MTTVPRRRPKPVSTPAFSATDPWPSQVSAEPRVTTEGKVSSLPSPVQAMWAEAIGRQRQHDSADCDWDEGSILGGEVEGLSVAIAILTCSTLEEVRAEVTRRTNMSVRRI